MLLVPSISSKRAAAQYSSLASVYNICSPSPRICKGRSFFANFFNCWIASIWTEFHSGGDSFSNWAKQFLYLEIFGMKSDMWLTIPWNYCICLVLVSLSRNSPRETAMWGCKVYFPSERRSLWKTVLWPFSFLKALFLGISLNYKTVRARFVQYFYYLHGSLIIYLYILYM